MDQQDTPPDPTGSGASRRRKIAVVGPFPPIKSGIARHTNAVLRALAARPDIEVKAWGFRRQYPAFLYPGGDEQDDSVNASDLGITSCLVGDNPLTWRRTVKQISDWGPDLIVVPAWTFAVSPALGWVARRLRRAGAEVCTIVHNAFDHEAAGWKDKLMTWQLAASDRFVTHNHALAEELGRRFPSAPTQVFPHPPFDEFPAPAAPLARRRALELLFFGVVRPYKGVDILLDAVAKLRRNDVALTIAGEFWDGLEDAHRRIAEIGPRTPIDIAPEFQSDADAAGLFDRADAIVMPYRSVSGSGVVSMALHYGKAIIASDLPGFREVVREGETGWFFAPGDAGALAQTIDNLNSADIRNAGTAARSLGKSLSWDRFAAVAIGDSSGTEFAR